MRLYYAPQTRAVRPRWLLEELGAPYELVRLDITKGEHKRAEYLKIHPHGAVPALVDDEVTMFESGAICLYLADKYPEKRMAPPLGMPTRALYDQWMIYSVATLEIPLEKILLHGFFLPEAERKPAILAEGKQGLAAIAKVLAPILAGRTYLLGDHFSAADVMMGSGLAWMRTMGELQGFPDVEAYAARVAARPAYQRAQAD
jgi:glutathione S-transferase